MKIQYFMSDLSARLGLGEIRDIHIAQDGGRTVLRIECDEMKDSEWKTITATQGPAKAAKKKPAAKKAPAPEQHQGIIGGLLAKRGIDIGKGADIGEMIRRG